jgi:hypothetical protein
VTCVASAFDDVREDLLPISLSRCESCGRRARLSRPGDEEARCEFCGGRLRQVWGLGQLVQRARADRGAGSPQLYESQVREALYGPQDHAAERPQQEPGAEPEDDDPA